MASNTPTGPTRFSTTMMRSRWSSWRRHTTFDIPDVQRRERVTRPAATGIHPRTFPIMGSPKPHPFADDG